MCVLLFLFFLIYVSHSESQSVGMIYITTESQDIFQFLPAQPSQLKTPLQGYKFDLLVPLTHCSPTNHWELEWNMNIL